MTLPIPELIQTYSISLPQAISISDGTRSLEQVKTRWTASELLNYEFPPPKYVVSGFITDGLNILGGRPKVGKSWLILQFLKSISTGGSIFYQKTDQRNCLYLALEDTPRRLKNRLLTQQWPNQHNCIFETRLPKKLDKGGIDWLKKEIETNQFQFVVIDTISRALSKKVKQSDVSDTTDVYDKLQGLALDLDCPIVIIDHFNKGKDADDVIDAILGSTGKVGVADTTIGIFKKRNYPSAQLKMTGRDIEERDLTIEFQKDTCTWELLGDTEDVITDRAIIKLIAAIQELKEDATSKELEKHLKWSKGYVSRIVNQAADDGRIEKGERGKAHILLDNTDQIILDKHLEVPSN